MSRRTGSPADTSFAMRRRWWLQPESLRRSFPLCKVLCKVRSCKVPLTPFVIRSRWVEEYAASSLVASWRSRAGPSRDGS